MGAGDDKLDRAAHYDGAFVHGLGEALGLTWENMVRTQKRASTQWRTPLLSPLGHHNSVSDRML